MSLDRDPAGKPSSAFGVALLMLCALALLTAGLLIYQEREARAPYARWQELHNARITRAGGHPQPEGIRQINAPQGVDRCPTCHLSIDDLSPRQRPVAQPLRGHPAEILKHHPPHQFGCTSCHGGSGSYVDRCLPAAGLARGKREIQASCLRCHREASGLRGAEKLTAGLRAYDRLGCGGCHRSSLAPTARIGPRLDAVSRKLTPGFLRDFIADPQRQRPGSAMPSFFSDQQLGHAPRSTQEDRRRNREQQIHSLASFLWHLQPPIPAEPPPYLPGDHTRGEQLFGSLGCVACHRDRASTAAADPLLGAVGPDLRRAGHRLSHTWIARWLQRPRGWSATTRMPDFRLTLQERGHLTSYLSILGVAKALRGDVLPPKELASSGRQLAQDLGCPGCHELKQLNEAPPVGPDLEGFGDKSSARLDWGGWSDPSTPRTPWTWTRLKLTRPLVFDRRPGVLNMPLQPYREGELEGLQLLMSALTDAPPPVGQRARPEEQALKLRRGEEIITRLNCRRCHEIQGRGGGIHELIPRPSERPPSLTGLGAKVSPAWLHSFLARPVGLRPWLALRMPTFNLSVEERRSLAAAFAAQDQASYPYVAAPPDTIPAQRLEPALELFSRLQCLRCHQLSNAAALKPGELSPDLALARARLRPEWIKRFILSPQQVMPGTKMPALFMLEDEDDPASRITPYPQYFEGEIPAQVNALVELTRWWGSAAAARRLGSARAVRRLNTRR